MRRDVSFDEPRRPVYEAVQSPHARSEEYQLALGGAGDYRGAMPLACGDNCCSNCAAISTRVER